MRSISQKFPKQRVPSNEALLAAAILLHLTGVGMNLEFHIAHCWSLIRQADPTARHDFPEIDGPFLCQLWSSTLREDQFVEINCGFDIVKWLLERTDLP